MTIETGLSDHHKMTKCLKDIYQEKRTCKNIIGHIKISMSQISELINIFSSKL